MNFLVVKSNSADFIYDINAIVSAFFPGRDVKVLKPGKVVRDWILKETEPSIFIQFEDNMLDFNIFGKESKWYFTDIKQPKSYKDEFKKFLYQALCEYTQKELPWGNLTGIRPTKIVMTKMEEGMPDTEIRDFLKHEHFVSDEKIELGLEIAKREKELLDTIHIEDGYSVYIGIAFCPTTCLYCSFTSTPIFSWKDRIQEYIDAIEKEIDFLADIYKNKKVDTIYIGGGTPTTLEASELKQLLDKIHSSFDFTYVKELTVEAGRPDSITREKLKVLYEGGVTRISINPQTMKEETLHLIGRRHTVEQTREAFYLAREIGFDNINMDIILGLPGETEQDVEHTIAEIEKLQPDSLTVHSLALKKASKLQLWIEKNGISTIQNTEKCVEIAAKGAARMGMVPYYLYRQKHMTGNFENVGYAKKKKYGLYNILIMEEKQTIVALGAGSISKRVPKSGKIERCDSAKDVETYIQNIDEMIERKKRLLEKEI